jgi:hypothetical protein
MSILVLWRPPEIHADGHTVTHTPFSVDFNGKTAYAAFLQADIASYFARRLALDKAYVAKDLSDIPLEQLRESDQAMVLRSRSRVDRLLSGRMMAAEFSPTLIRVR